MRAKAEILQQLCSPGVIAVIRARSRAQVLPLCKALVEGGVIALEITMTTPDAINAIHDTAEYFGGKALVGVGTILDSQTAHAAIDAGAEFVVSPICRREIAEAANARGAAVMLGAYTPTEAQLAHESGADCIKIFPADTLGPAYIKALRAPLPHLKIVPTGGVDLSTIGEFFKAGCVAVGVGSSLLSPKLIDQEDWTALTELAGRFVSAVPSRI